MTNGIEELKTRLAPREDDTHADDEYPYKVQGTSGSVIVTPPPEKVAMRSITFQGENEGAVKVIGFHPEDLRTLVQYFSDPTTTVMSLVGTEFEKFYDDNGVITITVTKPYYQERIGRFTFSQEQLAEAISLLNRFPQSNGLWS